jgi:hypothetical protein
MRCALSLAEQDASAAYRLLEDYVERQAGEERYVDRLLHILGDISRRADRQRRLQANKSLAQTVSRISCWHVEHL